MTVAAPNSTQSRHARLFALYRQEADHTEEAAEAPPNETPWSPSPSRARGAPAAPSGIAPHQDHLSDSEAHDVMQAATDSLHRPKLPQGHVMRLIARLRYPRNPVATTNFSEESDRLAGGLKLATLEKRRLSTA